MHNILFYFQLPLGLGIVASIRVGQYLGAGNADGAKIAARVAFVIMCKILLIVPINLSRTQNNTPK